MIGVGGGGACAVSATLRPTAKMNEMMNGLRVMYSSERGNSTTAEHSGGTFIATLLDWVVAASIAVLVIVATVGVDVRIAGVPVRAHDPIRIVAAVVLLAVVRMRLGIARWPAWLTRMMMLVAISGSVATWFRFLLASIGGADSWGYVSASEMLRQGRLVDPAPIADWLSASNRLAIASPLGWAPAPDGSGIVPTYPLGLPAVMALFSAIGGSAAVFFVAPLCALITLALVYRLARQWYSADTALFATALVAWNPVFIVYAKQPMSDAAATMWTLFALALAMRLSALSGFVGGLAAGAAVMTRPVLLPAAAVIALLSNSKDTPRTRAFAAAAGVAVVVVIQMFIQQTLFGSPLSTGYGSAGNLFAISHVVPNLKIYGGHIWREIGPVWLVGLFLGLMAARPIPRFSTSLLFGAIAIPYLFYLPFDHWETLRFLLPGLVPLTIVVADGLGKIVRLHTMSNATPALTALALLAVAVPAEYTLRHGSAWDIAAVEARYPLAGDWINVNTPPNSVVLANQHSGSLRWYGKRQTLRWDFIDPQQLTTTVRELQSHGATVYVALEGDEVKMFETRFAGVIEQLRVDPVGRVRNVSFLRLLAAAE